MATSTQCFLAFRDPLHGVRARRKRRSMRTGATMIETSVALLLFVAMLLGTVDLSYGIFRYHILAHSARQLARRAIVRGSLADRFDSWGPENVSVRADDTGPIAQSIAPSLAGWDLSDVLIEIDWVDGGNDADKGHRVRVRLSAPYEPMTLVLADRTVELTATSTMHVAH